MELLNKICMTIVFILVIFIIGYICGLNTNITQAYIDNDITKINDTIYNTTTLDSIEFNIIKKDTIIYNLTNKMNDEIKESYNLNDSAAIELFKQLVAE